MGLTKQSTGKSLLEKSYTVEKKEDNDFVIALAGNPNVGKSTVFNSLTGLNQHTGNWPGKTVTIAQGVCRHHERNYILVDLPGTYSLMANSSEEEVARDFICFEKPDAVVVVADATCLERNLNLVLQTLELCSNVVLCVNLIDEAEQKKIKVDFDELALLLGVPVVGTNARSGKGMDALMDAIQNVVTASSPSPHFVPCYEEAVENAIEQVQAAITPYIEGRLPERWTALKLLDGEKNLISTLNTKLPQPIEQHKDVQNALEAAWGKLVEYGIGRETLRDRVVSKLVLLAEKIASSAVSREKGNVRAREQRIDKLLTSRVLGFPLMIALLLVVFWITISGANVPSSLLATGFSYLEDKLNLWFQAAGVTPWLQDLVISGIYRTLTWVIAVMLPPMAIFFPLFTLLEDLGYLPRIAFNLDHFFKKACAHGKQALTMCIGTNGMPSSQKKWRVVEGVAEKR